MDGHGSEQLERLINSMISDIFRQVVPPQLTRLQPPWAKPRPSGKICQVMSRRKISRSRSHPAELSLLQSYRPARELHVTASPPSASDVELPADCWTTICEHVEEDDLLAFALSCKDARLAQERSGRQLVTTLRAATTTASRLRWARAALGLPWDERVTEALAHYGNLDVLRYAREKCTTPCPWSTGVLRRAAAAGHCHILEYAREKGCKWDSSVCAAASGAGRLDALMWLREHCCPWSDLTSAIAHVNGHRALLEWALEHGCDWNEHLVFRLRLTKVMEKESQA